MARLDWKRGRFDTDYEVNEYVHGIRGYQASQIGDYVEYFRFFPETSEMDDVFDEGFGQGKSFHPANHLPAIHVTNSEGPNDVGTTGFYFNDTLYVTTSWEIFNRLGYTFADLEHDRYMKDRVGYNNRLYRVTSIQVTGQVERRDIMLSIEATQIKPDELSNDPQFVQYAEQGPVHPSEE